jgi:hypothetical protein
LKGRLQLLEEALSVMKLGEDPKRTGRLERGRVVVFNGRFASQLQTMAIAGIGDQAMRAI